MQEGKQGDRRAALGLRQLTSLPPQRFLDLPDFWISRYPVTNAQNAYFLEAGGMMSALNTEQRHQRAYIREHTSENIHHTSEKRGKVYS